jgi:hypothetical protein
MNEASKLTDYCLQEGWIDQCNKRTTNNNNECLLFLKLNLLWVVVRCCVGQECEEM